MANAPDYELVASNVTGTSLVYENPDLNQNGQMTFKVTAVRADGRESKEGATVIRLLPVISCLISSTFIEGKKIQMAALKSGTA